MLNRRYVAGDLFNFCVTAQSLRAYPLEDLGKLRPSERSPFHKDWNENAFLLAVAEIANSSKHLRLRDVNGVLRVVRTRRVSQMMSDFVDIYNDGEGHVSAVQVEKSDIEVVLFDGRRFALYEFTASVPDYWRKRLVEHGLRITKQPLSRLSGD